MISFFYGLDHNILAFWHSAAEAAGGFLTPLAKVFTFIGEKGIWMLALAVILMCFAKTRKVGICLFGAVCCGALITNVVLKDLIARPRPFDAVNTEYLNWMHFVSAPTETGYSFPSGHVTAASAGVLALAFCWNKKVLYAGVPYVALMCFARNYLMAHYPTDVMAGCAVGLLSAVTAYGITLGIYAILEKFKDKKLSRLILYDIDAAKLFAKKSKQPAKAASSRSSSRRETENGDEETNGGSGTVEDIYFQNDSSGDDDGSDEDHWK